MAEEKDPLVGMQFREYVLARLLGQGAMGSVYLGRNQQTSRQVAIKFLSGEYASKNEFVNRFMNEGAACALLDHENIIRVFEAGQEDGTHFMVMEYVDGVDLAHFLKVQDKVKEAQALPWIKQTARALSYAHSQGIVHRDLKPENIMLTKDGKIKVADLGLSKNLEANESFSMTMSGTVIGTPYYISPEQARDAKRVDARTDIYSLGATFYHLVTGSVPFQGNSAAEVMAKHMDEQLTDPRRKNAALGDGFGDLITQMMQKDPARRFQSMDELIQAIERLEKGQPVIFQKVKLRKMEAPDSHTTEKPHWKSLVVAVGGAVLLALLVVLALTPKQKLPQKETTTTQKPGASRPETASTPSSPTPPVGEEKPAPAPQQQPTPEKVATAQPTVPPVPLEAPTANQSPGQAEEDTIQLAGSTDSPSIQTVPISINWVDCFGVVAFLVGIPIARQIGWFWGSIRAVAIWVAVIMVCRWFAEFGIWIHFRFALPDRMATNTAFLILSAVLMMPAWVLTHRLLGHQKETWQRKMDRAIAIVPGMILGVAFATWFMSLVAVLAPASFPVEGSWMGNRVFHSFPVVEQMSKAAK